VLVAVDRLENRIAAPQVGEVLGDDVEVVAVGMQRGHPELGALLTTKPVIVVGADMSHVLLAEHTHQATRDGGLSGRRVTDDAKDDGARHYLSSLNTEL
jgi:hypothetical protein